MRKFLAATRTPRYDPWERKCVTQFPSPRLHSLSHMRSNNNDNNTPISTHTHNIYIIISI